MDKRNTIQKKMVSDAVYELANHPTAEEVYHKVSMIYPSISKGTVYRNLSVLAEEGEIMKLDIPNEAVRYDHTLREHYHARCEKCGRVFDVDMDIIPDITDKIKDSHGFVFLGYDIFFKGICPECKEK